MEGFLGAVILLGGLGALIFIIASLVLYDIIRDHTKLLLRFVTKKRLFKKYFRWLLPFFLVLVYAPLLNTAYICIVYIIKFVIEVIAVTPKALTLLKPSFTTGVLKRHFPEAYQEDSPNDKRRD